MESLGAGEVGVWEVVCRYAGLLPATRLCVASRSCCDAASAAFSAWRASLVGPCPAQCCRAGDVEALWANVDLSRTLKFQISGGETLLHAAAASPSAHVLAFVSHMHGAREVVNAFNESGKTPLHVAASAGAPHGVETLLKSFGTAAGAAEEGRCCGLDVDAGDRYGATALVLAAREGRLGAVDALLRRGADVNAFALYAGPRTCTPLASAVDSGNEAVVRRILLEPQLKVDQALILGVPNPPTVRAFARTEGMRRLLAERFPPPPPPERPRQPTGLRRLAEVAAGICVRQRARDPPRNEGAAAASLWGLCLAKRRPLSHHFFGLKSGKPHAQRDLGRATSA